MSFFVGKLLFIKKDTKIPKDNDKIKKIIEKTV